MTVSDARKLKEREAENARLQKIMAVQMLAIARLKEIASIEKWRQCFYSKERLRSAPGKRAPAAVGQQRWQNQTA